MSLKKRVTIILAVIAFLLALGLTLYPLASNYVNQKYASQIHIAYQEVMEQTDDAALQQARERADAYRIFGTMPISFSTGRNPPLQRIFS